MIAARPLFLLMALFVGPVFSANGAVASRAIPSALSGETSGASDTVARTTSRTNVNRSTASRNTATNSRSTVSRVNTNSSRGTANRSGAQQSTVSRSTVGDINSNPAVRRAGVVLRPSFADFGGRATIGGTDRQTGSNIDTDIKKITGRAAKNTSVTKESIVQAKEKLEQTAELNKSCQEQYNECMDQFCAVIDTNQKRCSCSSNLSKYTKVEKAVTDANNKLNEVAQAIRYIGLSADEIRAIMTETEAEEALDSTRDTSTTRNMLKQIESMIKDPSSSTSTYSSDTDFGLDMDLTFSSDPLEIFNLDFMNSSSNSTISNMRGTELYNTAKKRCSTVLSQCKDAGATQNQITGNYDLAIDKDCIAYEAGLKKMNQTLVSNVNSANLMLQKARLAVLHNKNQYDARGCVAALESCMKDDMVCGDNYFKCVDPTKTYIDENGDVVLGQDITVIQSFMTNYNNAAIDSEFLSQAYDSTTIGKNTCTDDGKCVVKYLLQKIGTKAKSTAEGMCRPVLDKCQYYTYTDDVYQPYNDIVVNYVQRAMVNVRAAQQKIISEYASNCIVDVAACYNQQITQVNSWASSASALNIYGVMRGACRGVALTCGLAIFTGEPNILSNQELSVGDTTYHVSQCDGAGNSTYGSAAYNDAIINCVSNMFYQSLLCPENSTYQADSGETSANGTSGGWVNTKCKCNTGYDVWAGSCLAVCGANQARNSYGTCYCTNGGTLKNGVCVESSSSGGNSGGSSGDDSGGSSSGDDSGGSSSGGNSGGNSGGSTYTIQYKCSDNGSVVETQTVTYGQQFTTRPSSICDSQKPAGKVFQGWGIGGSSSSDSWAANAQYQSYSYTSNKTLVAKWRDDCTITFSCGNGGTLNGSSTVNSCSINLPQGSEKCSSGPGDFTGWSCNDGNNNVSNLAAGDTYSVSGNATCTAQWTGGTQEVTHMVIYDCGDGGSYNNNQITLRSCQEGGAAVSPSGTIQCTKEGSVFTGWNPSNSQQCNDDITFTAQWTATTYTVSYECGDHGTRDNSYANQTKTHGNSIYLYSYSDQGFVCTPDEHYVFASWLCTPDGGTATTYAGGAEYTGNANLSCVAQYDYTTQYTVSFNCDNGDSMQPNPISVDPGDSVTLPGGNVCSKNGWTMIGWNCDNTTRELGAVINPAKNISCVAIWAEHVVADENCSGYAGEEVWTGCVAAGFKCATGYMTTNGNCVDPCGGLSVSLASATSSCADFSSIVNGAINGCVAKHCQCGLGNVYSFDGPRCLQFVTPDSSCQSNGQGGPYEGCIAAGWSCKSDYVRNDEGECVDPCGGIGGSTTSDSSCIDVGDGDGGCVAPYCRCLSGSRPAQDSPTGSFYCDSTQLGPGEQEGYCSDSYAYWEYDNITHTAGEDGFVSEHCKCNSGYEACFSAGIWECRSGGC